MRQYYHSVTLDVERCKGCTNCIKGCPTEAIRVRNGKAYILENKCIDCGECIRICPNHAKFAATDDLEKLRNFKFNIALPAPSFFGQFKDGVSVASIMGAMKSIGFDEIYQVPLAAEEVSMAIKEYMSAHKEIRPLISSSCPAVIRLIQVRFPELIKNIIPIKSPMEIAARRAKEAISKKYGLKEKDIGAFFISPCPAKVTAMKQPVGDARSYVDGVLAMSRIYGIVIKRLSAVEFESGFPMASGIGFGWGRAGGENVAIGGENHLSVDGIHNCIDVLEEVEMNKLYDIDYIECQACAGGCIGGALTFENQFVARVKIRRLSERLGSQSPINIDEFHKSYEKGYYFMENKIIPKSSLKLDEDIATAIKKMDLLEKTLKDLPGLDCGSCGCPNCRALAEDIVQGKANETDCIFKLRHRVKQLASEMYDLSQKMPPTMEKTEEEVIANDP